MGAIIHGGDLWAAIRQYGGKADDWLDLSTGINPHNWPINEMALPVWNRLPGGYEEGQLLAAARGYYEVNDAYKFFCANGTQAIIQLLPQMFAEKYRVEIVQPTYDEHAFCWQKNGHEVSFVSVIADIDCPDIAVVVNPNNPDGRKVERSELLSLAGRLKTSGGSLIVDEAFGDVFPHLSMAGCGLDNVLVLKSFGKFFGLAGVRLGFAIGNERLIGQLAERTGPWAVSGPALEIGNKALRDIAWITKTRAWIIKQSEKQMAMLAGYGMEPAGNGGLFVQTRHGRSAEIFEQLSASHILVRKFSERQDFLRFGLCANKRQMERLAAGLEGVING